MSANIKEDIHQLLKKYWGFEAFRPMQQDIIQSVLENRDTLALLPTGGGKSLCFQVPGLYLGGTTLVISPLVALMNDQVRQLKKRGLTAVAINSAMSFREINIALSNAAQGHVQFLYVSPERLQNDDFKMQLSYLPVTLIAVDEAHCISQWGYDFRPSYLKVAELRDYFPKVPFIALTASATREVVKDIQEKLLFRNGAVFRSSFARGNLRYVVQLEEGKLQRLLKLIRRLGGSGIVYLRNRKKTEELASALLSGGISAAAYHAGLKYDQRQSIQDSWIGNKVQVICATNAFGMGIDKPDVRFVAHLDLPDTLEAYFQEAGRAGRDGKTAYAALFFTRADQLRLEENYRSAFPEPEQIKQVYSAICNYFQVAIGSGLGTSFEFDIAKVCASYNLQPLLVFNSIRFLEKDNYLSLIDTGYEPSKVMILAGKEDLYEFQVKHPKYEPLIKTLLRSYGGLLESYVHISEKDIAYRIKSSTVTVEDYLRFLDKQQLLSYMPQSALPRVLFLRDRVNSKFVEFDPQNYNRLKELHAQKMRAVLDYTSNDQVCRQRQLLVYFGESEHSDCGFCDVCVKRQGKGTAGLKSKMLEKLGKGPLTFSELRECFQEENSETLVMAFNELMDEGTLTEKDGKISIK